MRGFWLRKSGRAVATLAAWVTFASVAMSSPEFLAQTDDGLGPMDPDEMRIAFMGTSFIPRLSQEANSVFVQCGTDGNFVFDCGSGVISKYISMNVAYSQMDKIFLTHIHGDHMSDLSFIYLFGPAGDRLTDLHVWGPTGPSAEEGITAFCDQLRSMTQWHRLSFSFLSTGLTNGQDGYTLVPHECSYTEAAQSIHDGNGPPVVYDADNVTISYFPSIHTRDGSIAFKLQWRGLSMIFSGDSQPNTMMIDQAAGIDVLVHELTLSPEVWAEKNSGLAPDPNNPFWVGAVNTAKRIQDSSHTPARAFGYLLSQTNPRLGIATHFQNQSDTIDQVKADVRAFYPFNDGDNPPQVLFATDLMVVNIPVDKGQPIYWRQAHGNPYAFNSKAKWYSQTEMAPPLFAGPRDQLSTWLQEQIISPQVYELKGFAVSGDYDGDGTADPSVFSGPSGLWSVNNLTRVLFGSASDYLVPADYDGDGTTEMAAFSPSTGLWSIKGLSSFYLGATCDVPVPGDYDGDGTVSAGVFRDSSALWIIRNLTRLNFGASGDTPLPGDYTADGVTDIAIFRKDAGLWSARNLTRFYLGSSSDQPVPGDYNAAGKWEAGIFRSSSGLWVLRNLTRFYLGASTDRAVPADYTGNGIDRPAVFRASTGLWSVRNLTALIFGSTGDVPLTR